MPFLGMRGSGDWDTTMVPENWRETILYLYPNGMAPLTAIMSKLGSESTDNAKFHWFQKTLPDQRGVITGVWTNAALSAAYASGGVVGDVVYLQMAAADQAKFRQSHQVLIRSSVTRGIDVTGKVTTSVAGGASSYIGVKLLEADDNGVGVDLSDANTVIIIGTVNEEGAKSFSGLIYDPTEYWNYTQIFRTPLEHTRTAMKTKLRTGDDVKRSKKEALELHGIEIEKAYIFGERSLATGDVYGKPQRTTRGIKNWITTNKVDYATTSNGAWLTGGKKWFNAYLEQLFRYGSTEKLGFVGSGALLGIQELVLANSQYNISAKTMDYGIKVVEWVTPFGTLYLKTHPLFTIEATLRNSMCIVDTEFLNERYIDNTTYKPKIEDNDVDGEKSEYLTEAGIELHHELAFGWADGIGEDATL
jgi:hypothetical protein